jgi:hypothetical protein
LSIQEYDIGTLKDIDSSHRVLREDIALDVLNQMRGSENHRRATAELEDSVVLTKCNNKTYSVRTKNFDMTPPTTFVLFNRTKNENRGDAAQSLVQRAVQHCYPNDKQPLIENFDKKHRSMFLIIELCLMADLADKQRTDFRLTKEMATATHKDARSRMEDVKKLFRIFSEYAEFGETMEQWNMKISSEPIVIGKGLRFNPGNFLLSKRALKGTTMQTSEVDYRVQRLEQL